MSGFVILTSMDSEEKRLLEQTSALVKENNKILLSMERRARIGTALRIFYWLVIIAVSVGAYTLIEPYVGELGSIYTQAQKTLKDINQAP